MSWFQFLEAQTRVHQTVYNRISFNFIELVLTCKFSSEFAVCVHIHTTRIETNIILRLLFFFSPKRIHSKSKAYYFLHPHRTAHYIILYTFHLRINMYSTFCVKSTDAILEYSTYVYYMGIFLIIYTERFDWACK